MRIRPAPFAAAVCLALGAAAFAGPDATPPERGGTVELRFKAARTWDIDLPAERFEKVSGALDFRAAGGKRFAVALEGDALAIDTDGDGETDVKVTGKEGFVRLQVDGERPFSYALRLVNAGGGWRYAAGGARVGKLGETRITLIDQDGDGRYDGYGRDAMIVGLSRCACFLSRVVNVDGRLVRIDVAPDGASIRQQPHTGPRGTLDLATKWDAQAKLQSVIVLSEDDAFSFDLAAVEGGLVVPAGRYRLHSGKLGLGQNVVRFTQGRAKVLEVTADATTTLAAGGPLSAEFAYQREGGEVVFTPATLRWFGRLGEEYVGWKPFGKSPVFTVSDAGTRETIAEAIFTGC